MMIARHKLDVSLKRDSAGAVAVEFALIAPVIIMMIVGGIYVGMMGFTASSMHFAVEAAARCRSVNTTSCSDASSTQNYANARFTNLAGNAATFTATTPACGNQVTGSVTFTLGMGVATLPVPLTATSCFP